MPLPPKKVAFVTGANGISGFAIVEHLVRQPESEWSHILVSSRRPMAVPLTDPRITFVAIDFLDPVPKIVQALSAYTEAKDITHAFFTSYVHANDFKLLREKNVPLFRNFLEVMDTMCPRLERICLQTGGKNYGAHLGPALNIPHREDQPRSDDPDNFYYPQEDDMFAVAKGKKWGWNVIRPNGVIGFTPHGSGISEVLSMAAYLLLVRELNESAAWPWSEFMWTGADDKSYAPAIGHMSVWATTEEHCKNEAFNCVNGDIIIWKYFWPVLAKHFGINAPEPVFDDPKRPKHFDMEAWAKDKRPVWERVVKKYGGKVEAFDWCSWDYLPWCMGRTWSSLSSMNKARKFGWTRFDDSQDTYLSAIRCFENAGVLPRIPAQVNGT
ncbi:hypothetical protein Z517_05903 [Fonsecaea pedrosoi CBS 271.37]|uniref:PRISE-like Rossmann-fold domain-containing protein n=1 Tax=Fonsecaea pedrosoi CBS 271.37 TaxID=1442368 RepID=A0A0D2DNH7_9EURO|nr:uncharacterized protein Z517_05903 [Fonsecaea pedrosoi CBS 271.37]KIW79291.1 hypothetical protein Z517_05903 [Fonsecaea pedrosoi CBS 271.37]